MPRVSMNGQVANYYMPGMTRYIRVKIIQSYTMYFLWICVLTKTQIPSGEDNQPLLKGHCLMEIGGVGASTTPVMFFKNTPEANTENVNNC